MKKLNYLKISVLAINACLLSNCSLIAPVKTPNTQEYLIKYNSVQVACKNQSNYSIYVQHTSAEPPYNTNNMYYSTTPYSLNHYNYSIWATLPQNSINQAVEQMLSNSCLFNNVVNHNNNMISTDYTLNSKIVEIKQNIINSTPQAVIKIQVYLINNKKRVINNKLFIEKSPIKASPENMAIGISTNLEKFLDNLNTWISTQTKASEKVMANQQ